MDLLSQHEAFLRAIFDTPDDDTPRLVYADFLQEQGEDDRAELIRVQCELVAEPWSESSDRQCALSARERVLLKKLYPACAGDFFSASYPVRGFALGNSLTIKAAALSDPTVERWRIVRTDPGAFGVKTLNVASGTPLQSEHVDVLFALPATQRITEWFLDGSVSEELSHSGPGAFDLVELVQQPAITTRGVETLAQHRGARRITSLDLRNNNLDNDAARALVKSPYLDNLKRLQLLEGNRFRGRVWQQVIERFGEDVVG
jgi:uncharacterized protein (TIGR02996 family)